MKIRKKYFEMNKKIGASLLIGLTASLGLSGCTTSTNHSKSASTKPNVSLNYSAAASLQPALTKLYKTYHKAHPNVTINFDFAGSGVIRQKVLAGAPIDGVFLASTSDMNLIKAKVTDASVALGNQLVAIVPRSSSASGSLSELVKNAKKIAIGMPATVPAGKYAEQALTHLKLYSPTYQSKFVQASDVTQALSYVAAGNADLGFVYKTDAATNQNVKIAATVPDNEHSPIVYPLATLKGIGKDKLSATKAFNHYLKSATADKVFKSYEFSIQK